MHVNLFYAFYRRKFSTNHGEIRFGVALNTLDEIPSHPSNRVFPYYEVCTEHYRFSAAILPKENNYVILKILIMQFTTLISNFFKYSEVLSIFQPYLHLRNTPTNAH